MSKLEVDAIEPQSGTTITVGASGDTITVPSGATLNVVGTFAQSGDTGITGAVTITTTDNTAGLTLKSTDADANSGPLLDLIRESSSPADGDSIGQLSFIGKDSGGVNTEYARIKGIITDVTNNTEDGALEFLNFKSGFLNNALILGSTETVFNDASVDVDFRVESNGNANMLFVDGGNDKVGIGTSAPQEQLDISSNSPRIRFSDTSVTDLHHKIGSEANDLEISCDVGNDQASSHIGFKIDGSEKVRITDAGLVGIGTSSPSTSLHISSASPQISLTETDQSNKQYRIGSFGGAYAVYDVSATQYRHIIDTNGNHIFNEGSQDCDFRVESNNNANMLFVDGGNDAVGIGAVPTESTHALLVQGSNGTLLMSELENLSGPVNFQLTADDTEDCRITFGDKADNGRGRIVYSNTSEHMRFEVNNLSEAMRIHSSGKVSIGTTTADGILIVTDNDNETYLVVQNAKSGGSGEGVLSLKNDVGNWQVKVFTDDSFRIRDNANGADRFTINTSGNVGIGTTAPAEKLHVVNTGGQAVKIHSDTNNSGDLGASILSGLDTPSSSGDCKWVRLADGNDSGKAYIQFKSSSPNAEFAAISDERLKTNIQNTDVVGLDVINNLRLVKFDWNETATQNAGWSMHGHQKLGFVAQEVEAIVPEFISEDTNGFKIMGDSGFVPYLIKAMQEQQTKIQELEARITTLENA
jgi:hypothetical protein